MSDESLQAAIDLRIHDTTDVFELIESLIAEVQEAKSVPLSGAVIIDREMLIDRLQKLQAILPDELRAARWMVRERRTRGRSPRTVPGVTIGSTRVGPSTCTSDTSRSRSTRPLMATCVVSTAAR